MRTAHSAPNSNTNIGEGALPHPLQERRHSPLSRLQTVSMVATVLAGLSSCNRSRHHSSGPITPTEPFAITIIGDSTTAPRTKVCGEIVPRAGTPLDPQVALAAFGPHGEGPVQVELTNSDFCFTPAGAFQESPTTPWQISLIAKSPTGESRPVTVTVLPYTQELAANGSVFLPAVNGQGPDYVCRVLPINPTTGAPVNTPANVTRFIISQPEANGVIVAQFNGDGAGLGRYELRLVPGKYWVHGENLQTGARTPERPLEILAVSGPSFGIGQFQQLDNAGNLRVDARWWDLHQGQPTEVRLEFPITYSAHLGGVGGISVSPDPTPTVISIQPLEQSFTFTPHRSGDARATVGLTLAGQSQATVSTFEGLVLPPRQ